MARYFIPESGFEEQPLMISVSACYFLKLFPDEGSDLEVYGALRKILSLSSTVQLYHELQTAQMDFTDLELLEEAEKERTSLAI